MAQRKKSEIPKKGVTIDDFSLPFLLPMYPKKSGVYLITDEHKNLLYIGSCKQLCQRISHLLALQNDKSNKAGYSHIKAAMLRKLQESGQKVFIRFFECNDYKAVEKELIKKYRPSWNVS